MMTLRFSSLVIGLIIFDVHTLAYFAEPPESGSPDNNLRSVVQNEDLGQISGVVTDVSGLPLTAALISVSGASGSVLTGCDAEGRFKLQALPPGVYLLRAHLSGFTTTRRYLITVESGSVILRSISLRRISNSKKSASKILASGFPMSFSDESGQHEQTARPTLVNETDSIEIKNLTSVSSTPHTHSEKTWQLRRARRSVLKDTTAGIQLLHFDYNEDKPDDRSLDNSNNLFSKFLFLGQLRLVARTIFDFQQVAVRGLSLVNSSSKFLFGLIP